MQIKTTMRYHLTPVRMAIINKASASEDVEKGECFCTVGGNIDWDSHCGKKYGVTSKKIKNRSAFRPSNPISGNISEGTQNTNLKEYKHPYVHCSVIYHYKIWKQPKCASIDEWIKQLWDIYTMEYYSAIKRRQFYPL